jgi:ArsR family transcriptional regulator
LRRRARRANNVTMARVETQAIVLEPDVQECCSPLVADPLSEGEAVDRARVFKALSDPTRLRLLSLIAAHADGEVCVCDLTGEFDVTAPTISFHLRVLREAGLVTSERRATWVYYRADQQMLAGLSVFFAAPALSAR